MNTKHELEWAYRPGFDFADCKYAEMNKDFSFEHFGKIMEFGYEIQRVEIELRDGYQHTIQSRYRNIIGMKRLYLTAAEATGKNPHAEVFHFNQWRFRILDIKQIRIWYETPPYAPKHTQKR